MKQINCNNIWLSFKMEIEKGEPTLGDVTGWTQCEEEASCVADCSLTCVVKGYYVS
jgi:hypothetical protein